MRYLATTCLLLGFLLAACTDPGPRYPGPVEFDMDEILERDTLRLITTTNSTSYFLYRGEPMGFEYELAQAFAEEHDLVLQTIVVQHRDSLFHALNRGDGDVVAARLMPSAIDTPYVAFTTSLYTASPVIVQAQDDADEADLTDAAEDALDLATNDFPEAEVPDTLELSARLVERPADLEGRTVHLGRQAYVDRLAELSDDLTGDIVIVEVEGDVSLETLIRQVADGDIALTVSQENLARLKEEYFENIVVRPVVGEEEYITWAVRKTSTNLHAVLNVWLEEQKDTPLINNLYRRYFVDRRGYRARQVDEYLTSETGRLSSFDALFETNAREIGWDWRLLASMAFQESRFDPRARSWAGAQGLLQLMPPTAREFGVTNVYDPGQNVQGAVRFIQWLEDYWEDIIADETERRKFVLASYNTGHGHVQDARRLAEKYGDNPDIWEDTAYWLLQKSRREVYEDPVVRFGYARGLEPVTYVAKILDRYDHYRQFVTDEPVIVEARAEQRAE
jgi:membrane-bound lytic murein transglycosylase F